MEKRHRALARHITAGLSAALALAIVVAAPPALADGIVTDRPDAAESSETVGKFRFQIEAGASFATTKAGDNRMTAIRTPTKLRFGLLDWWELHVESGWLAHDRVTVSDNTASDTGLADIDVGTKIHFLHSAGLVPSMGALLAVTLPVGTDGQSGEAVLIKPTLAADFALGDAWGVGSNLGATIAASKRDSAADTLRYAVSVGRTWAPLTDKLRTYVELFGETPFEGGDTALTVDGGFTFLALPNLQFDVSVAVGLTDQAADFGVGFGAGFKI